MRAMYYTVKYKIHLPTLRHALHEGHFEKGFEATSHGNSNTKSESASDIPTSTSTSTSNVPWGYPLPRTQSAIPSTIRQQLHQTPPGRVPLLTKDQTEHLTLLRRRPQILIQTFYHLAAFVSTQR